MVSPVGRVFEYDFDAVRAAPTRIVIAAGAESEGELAHRGAVALAEHLGTEPVMSRATTEASSGAESGYPGEPDAFAATLREVLST